MKAYGGMWIKFCSLPTALGGGGIVSLYFNHFIPEERAPSSTGWQVYWAPKLVWVWWQKQKSTSLHTYIQDPEGKFGTIIGKTMIRRSITLARKHVC